MDGQAVCFLVKGCRSLNEIALSFEKGSERVSWVSSQDVAAMRWTSSQLAPA